MEPLEQLTPKTQQLLQPLFAKPKLNDKLLSKPPFRFLHDIITAVAESTGFTKGLFTPEELDTEAIKENKQAKLNFLQKAIDIVGICTGQAIDCRPSKIVAGAEPENTNIWLQALAKVASDPDTDNEEAVRRTLAGAKPGELPAPKKSQRGSAPPSAAPSEAKREESKGGDEDKERRQKESEEKEREDKARADSARRAEEKALEDRAAAKRAEEQEREAKEREAKARRAEEEERAAKANNAASAPPPVAESKAISNESATAKKPSGGVGSQIAECNGDIPRTQETLGKLITTPKLTEKLLGKPPFRFLQDIVTEVTRVTGFAAGLFSEAELESANKDKDTKIAFLTKIIRCVSAQLGVQVEARPAKIVAGLESEKTNAFLQLLAVAAQSGNSDAAVQAALRGEDSAPADSQKAPISEPSAPPKATDSSQPKESSRPSSGASAAKAEEKAPAKTDGEGTKAAAKQQEVELKTAKPSAEQVSFPPASPRQGDDDPTPAPSTSRKTARPTTARRKPPKLKENVREVDRPSAAEVKVAAPTHIMKEGANSDSEGEGSDNEGGSVRAAQISAIDGEKHGKLVRNILSDSKQTAEEAKKEEEDKKSDSGIRLGRLKKTAEMLGVANTGTFTQEQIDNLRKSIQKLCQASNPLGKCMDYVHDDVETMVKELSYWRAEYSKDLVLLEKEQKATEESTQQTKLQIVELTEQVKEQVAKINALKASIAKNDARIQQLLRMVISG